MLYFLSSRIPIAEYSKLVANGSVASGSALHRLAAAAVVHSTEPPPYLLDWDVVDLGEVFLHLPLGHLGLNLERCLRRF